MNAAYFAECTYVCIYVVYSITKYSFMTGGVKRQKSYQEGVRSFDVIEIEKVIHLILFFKRRLHQKLDRQ